MANHKKHYAMDYKKKGKQHAMQKYIYIYVSIFIYILKTEPADNITKKNKSILPSHSINIHSPCTVFDFLLT